jgi:hypothetical protein
MTIILEFYLCTFYFCGIFFGIVGFLGNLGGPGSFRGNFEALKKNNKIA